MVVGLEPVAVSARANGDVWVVNHLSDSVSIVRADGFGNPSVVNTLFVGDEPRDIVFAGPNQSRAFITTAHRGQNSPDDPDLFNPASGRADVWVFDADNPGTAGGTRLTKITLFADTPRALAASADGKTVYAAAFFSGDQTTVVSEDAVNTVYGGVMPGPAAIDLGGQIIPQPTTGLVVKWKLGPDGNYHWIDAYGTIFDPFVRVSLPDEDVFAIDATANPPVETAAFAHVGTTLFNMAVNPKSGKVYVSNTDAHNDVRFAGHTPGFTSVAGNLVDSRITVIDPIANRITADNLNSHLNHAAGTGNPALSLAFPEDLVLSGRRQEPLRRGARVQQARGLRHPRRSRPGRPRRARPARSRSRCRRTEPRRHPRRARRPRLRPHALRRRHLGRRRRLAQEVGHVRMFSPEPASVTVGRQFLYNATLTSALGDQACASCHIGGDFDGAGVGPRQPREHPAANHHARRHRERHPHHPRGRHRGAHRAPGGRLHLRLRPALQGPDDDAEPPRPRQPRPDALAR